MPHQNLHPRITRDRCWLAPQNLQPRITRDLAFSARIPRITRAASCPPPALVSKPPQGGWAEEYSQPVGAKYGPGHCNKYVALNATPCFVRYQPDEIAIVGTIFLFDIVLERWSCWRAAAAARLCHQWSSFRPHHVHAKVQLARIGPHAGRRVRVVVLTFV